MSGSTQSGSIVGVNLSELPPDSRVITSSSELDLDRNVDVTRPTQPVEITKPTQAQSTHPHTGPLHTPCTGQLHHPYSGKFHSTYLGQFHKSYPVKIQNPYTCLLNHSAKAFATADNLS